MIYDQQNIFAKILRKEVPCKKVYEDRYALAFHDLHPSAPVHVLVIPKGEFISFSHFVSIANQDFIVNFFISVQKVIKILEIENSGYRMISNCGVDGMQAVPHFHIHILGKKRLGVLVAGDNFHT
ncbi:MAG: HIT domain-containing protein [Candidatus Midichloria sp.]|uniref:HIT domain-containing protein n=1 Tax=Hyalomma marginatum TaxID=34627 RepID=A0A8S4C3N2_9ACAR|nr:HIT domain-containing protein [Hyalomma marginatum]CAG7591931.1 HIT domain-containing protein [Hyalomma marginatum]